MARSLMDRAVEYVNLLAAGSDIIEDTDGPVVADFRHLLAPLLFRRGLYLVAIPGGQRVTDTAPWLVRRLQMPEVAPVWCCRCSRSLFDPNCEHGIRYVIDLGEPDWPGWLPAAARTVLVSGSGAAA